MSKIERVGCSRRHRGASMKKGRELFLFKWETHRVFTFDPCGPMLTSSCRIFFSLATTFVLGLLVSGIARAAEQTLYVGTYTRGTESRGIYVYRFDDATGALTPASIAEDVENPSFLALHPNRKFLFSSDEIDTHDGQAEGAISAWAIDDTTGALTLINRVGAGGTSPCHLVVDPAGRNVLAVGYGSGTVAVFPIDAGGRLQAASTRIEHQGASVDPVRQTSPHPHQVVLDPAAKRAYIPDLGLDQIVAYEFDSAAGTLTPSDPPAVATAPGAGPRHLAFHPDGRHAFSINELDLTITAFDYDPNRGLLTPRETVSAIDKDTDRTGVSGAEIAVHPNGKFLYASLRGTNEIVAFKIAGDEVDAPKALKFRERGPQRRKSTTQLHPRPHRPMAPRRQSRLRQHPSLPNRTNRPPRTHFKHRHHPRPRLPQVQITIE